MIIQLQSKKETGYKLNKPVLSDYKNFWKNQNDQKKRLNNNIQIKFLNPFPIFKPDDNPSINGMALAGFICGLLSIPLVIVGTFGGAFFSLWESFVWVVQ